MIWFLVIYGSIECENLMVLGKGLNLHSSQPKLYAKLNSTDCCNVPGISCVNNSIYFIVWSFYGLNGTINATALPRNLTKLDLQHNSITGEVPVLPPLLKYAYLFDNLLNGSIPQLNPEAYDVRLHNNMLTGPLPFKYPLNLGLLFAYNNMLTGNIRDYPTLSLHVGNNLLTGSLPSFTFPRHQIFRNLLVQGNFLVGQVPNIPLSTKVLYLGEYPSRSNNFTGQIILNAPLKLVIYGNLITNVSIVNTNNIDECDLRANLLTFVPLNLQMCKNDSDIFTSSIMKQDQFTTTEYNVYSTMRTESDIYSSEIESTTQKTKFEQESRNFASLMTVSMISLVPNSYKIRRQVLPSTRVAYSEVYQATIELTDSQESSTTRLEFFSSIISESNQIKPPNPSILFFPSANATAAEWASCGMAYVLYGCILFGILAYTISRVRKTSSDDESILPIKDRKNKST